MILSAFGGNPPQFVVFVPLVLFVVSVVGGVYVSQSTRNAPAAELHGSINPPKKPFWQSSNQQKSIELPMELAANLVQP